MKILKGIWIGLWSGIILGLLMKWIQAVTGEEIYNLLLNVDFLPFFGSIDWSEPVEFFFHLIIAVIIGIVYVYIAKTKPFSFGMLVIISLVMCLPLFPLYFILSSLAIRDDVPGLTDGSAILYWTFAHLTYALLLPILYKMFERKNAASH